MTYEPLFDRTTMHIDSRMEILALTADLCRLFAQDESEKANIVAIDLIKDAFKADAAVLFYVNGQKNYRICIAGTSFPISLPEPRWLSSVESHVGGVEVSQFGPWSIPGMDKTYPYWISVCIYTTGHEGGYVFLGRNSSPWHDIDSSALASIKEAIAPIVEVRHQRAVEAAKRKRAEQLLVKNESRLRDLFDGSRDMIYTADTSDIITSVNVSGVTLLGYESKKDIIGKPISSFFANPGDRKPFLEKLAHDGYVDDYELIITRKDGVSIFCLETAHALKDNAGTILETQSIVKDITSRIDNERKLWKMNLELAEANLKLQKTQTLMVQNEKLASIGQLAAGVAHELNNPLGFLVSNNTTLRKHFGKLKEAWENFMKSPAAAGFDQSLAVKLNRAFDDSGEIFNESKDGFDRIVKIVSSLKNFSRVDQSAAFDEFDVNAGIESTLIVAWNEIKYVSDLRKNLSPLPLIRANGGEINQVILNIVVNAAHAIGKHPRGGLGLIEITTVQNGESVLITIRDNGVGIPKDIINKVFDPFFTTKEPGKGTGLGLSISYDIIVNKHSGTIEVESDPGTGTTFYISLPIAGPRENVSAPLVERL